MQNREMAADQLPAFMAAEGLYEWVIDQIAVRRDLSSVSLLDLGAGSGAFAQLIRPLVSEVVAVDLELFSSFRVDDVPFVKHDLSDPALPDALGRRFDVITSIETIEHLENPSAFLRNIRELLAPDGFALLTTPNVSSLPSRIEFLQTGQLRGFRRTDEPTHITPIPDRVVMGRLADRAGLRVEASLTYPEVGFIPGGSRFGRALDRVMHVLKLNGLLSGECIGWVLSRRA